MAMSSATNVDKTVNWLACVFHYCEGVEDAQLVSLGGIINVDISPS